MGMLQPQLHKYSSFIQFSVGFKMENILPGLWNCIKCFVCVLFFFHFHSLTQFAYLIQLVIGRLVSRPKWVEVCVRQLLSRLPLLLAQPRKRCRVMAF